MPSASGAKFGLDTSCLVPLLLSGHPRHQRTLKAFDQRMSAREVPVVSCHALLETFSVLTRMPPPHRIPAPVVLAAFRKVFGVGVEIVSTIEQDAWSAIEEICLRSLHGGMVHDAAIAAVTFRAGARTLLTWNVRDFIRVAPPGLAVREP